jgi:hypothetical protein
LGAKNSYPKELSFSQIVFKSSEHVQKRMNKGSCYSKLVVAIALTRTTQDYDWWPPMLYNLDKNCDKKEETFTEVIIFMASGNNLLC